MKKTIIALLATSSVAAASELDNLIHSSEQIVSQINKGIMYVGSATEYSHTGMYLTDGTVSQNAHITPEQVSAYNDALTNMQYYLPYGSVKQVLENQAEVELDLMDNAIDDFTTATVQIIQAQQVNEMAAEASTPDEEAEVQAFVENNIEVLTVDQGVVDDWNSSLDEVEVRANNASAFLAVAGNDQAVEFLEQGVKNANTTADQTNIFYNANQQWVAMGYNTTRNLTAVYLNGENFGLDLYVTEADILSVGSDTDFYLTGPTSQGYNCFMFGTDCEYESIGN